MNLDTKLTEIFYKSGPRWERYKNKLLRRKHIKNIIDLRTPINDLKFKKSNKKSILDRPIGFASEDPPGEAFGPKGK